MQYNSVMLATLAMFIVELVLIVPANRQIYIESDKMVRRESEYLDTGKVIKSRSSWSYWLYDFWSRSDSNVDPADKTILSVSNPEKLKG